MSANNKTNKLSEQEMIAVIWGLVAESGSQHRIAQSLNITDSYLSDVLHGKRSISESLARKIGYIKHSVFEATSSDD